MLLPPYLFLGNQIIVKGTQFIFIKEFNFFAEIGANVETGIGQKIVQDSVSEIEQLAMHIESTADIIAQVERDSENINIVLNVI